MPIKPENKKRYPRDWKRIADAIRERAANRCEGSPAYPDCRAANGEAHPITGSRVVLTVAHMDHTPENCDPNNLRAWCQRCHLTYDGAHRRKTGRTTTPTAALFVLSDSIYKTLPNVDCYDIERDARTWRGGCPVIAHPPCRTWGSLSCFVTNAPPHEHALGFFAIDMVRRYGGVLEHPARSRLFRECGIPNHWPDRFGGWTLTVNQYHWGHKASKPTRLYIVGCSRRNLPDMPHRDGTPTHCITQDHGSLIGSKRYKPRVTDRERQASPPAFARWLVELARRCAPAKQPAILYRCMICGIEYKTVEECSACEDQHQ